MLDKFERGDRIKTDSGNFLSDPLPPADCYLLSNIIHDWGDTEVAAILNAIRRAASLGSTLLLFEFVVPEDSAPFDDVSDIDVFMLTLVSGRERTLPDYEQLLSATDWRLMRTVPTPSQTIIEATAV